MGTAGRPCSSSSARFQASQNGPAAAGRDSPSGSSYLPARMPAGKGLVLCSLS